MIMQMNLKNYRMIILLWIQMTLKEKKSILIKLKNLKLKRLILQKEKFSEN